MIAAYDDAITRARFRVYRADVCALMMTLADMACGVPLVCAAASEFLDRAWSLKAPITARGWPYLPEDRVNISGRTLSLKRNPTRDGMPQLLAASYLDLYFGAKCADEFMIRSLIMAYSMHSHELELTHLVRKFVVDYYCPAAVRRVEAIVAFSPREDGYATMVKHLEKTDPLDDATRDFLSETRGYCTLTIPFFQCAQVMFSAVTNQITAGEPWIELRQLLIEQVGMDQLAKCVGGVLADASIRVLPSFSSDDETIFLVGQPSPSEVAAPALSRAARGHPFPGLDLDLPLRSFPTGLARALRELESGATASGKADSAICRYLRLVQTYIRTVSFGSHPEMQAFVLTAYVLTLQPRDLPRVSAVRGCRLEPHPRPKPRRKDLWRAVFFLKCMFVHFQSRQPIEDAGPDVARMVNDYYDHYRISVLLVQATGVVIGPANCSIEHLTLKSRAEVQTWVTAATRELMAGRMGPVRDVFGGVGRIVGNELLMQRALAVIRGLPVEV
ncbi:hypothetical protein V1506DRAFT_465846 [Lipomyces tetrasporus]